MNSAIQRTDRLLNKKFRQLTAPGICSAVAYAVILCVDSYVAGHFISMSALAAIALCAPLFALDEAMHNLIGMGLGTQISQAVGRGEREKANRIVGAAIPTALIAYAVVLLPFVLFPEYFLRLLASDPELIRNAVRYAVPSAIAMPFFEMMLCLERAYQIDGRATLFASRSIITGCCNIVLDLVFVLVLHTDIIGLALATIISTVIGYCVTLSHGFSKKCTIRPDFSVLRNGKEWLTYTKNNLIRGGSAAINEVLGGFIDGIICRLLAVYGVAALAIWSVFRQLTGLTASLKLGISTSMNLLGGMLYGEEDFDGTRAVFKQGVRIGLILTAVATVLIVLLIRPIAWFFGIEPGVMSDCVRIIRISCPAYILFFLVDYTEEACMAVDRFRLSYTLNFVEKALIIVCVFIASGTGTLGIILGYEGAFLMILLYLAFRMRRDGLLLLPPAGDYDFLNYSLPLVDTQIVEVSKDIQNQVTGEGYARKTAVSVALLAEDGLNMIKAKNPGVETLADVRVCVKEQKLILSFTDNGVPYDLSSSPEFQPESEDLESFVIRRVADEIRYDRVLELNSLIMKLRVQTGDVPLS